MSKNLVVLYSLRLIASGLERPSLKGQILSVRSVLHESNAQMVDRLLDHAIDDPTEAGSIKVLERACGICQEQDAELLFGRFYPYSKDRECLAVLRDRGVAFSCCDIPAATEHAVHLLLQLAEAERQEKSVRASYTMRRAKAAGQRLGNPNIDKINQGPKPHLKSAQDKGRQVNRERAHEFAESLRPDVLSALGKRNKPTLQSIADSLNQRGRATRRGYKWSPQTVRNLLQTLQLNLNHRQEDDSDQADWGNWA